MAGTARKSSAISDVSPSVAELIRPEAIGPLLVEATGDERWRAFNARLITGGKSNLTFELTSAAGALILRRPPSGAILPRGHDMGREARVQRALASTSVPVAPIVLECDDTIIGVSFYVMEKVPGRVVFHEFPDGYARSPQSRRALSLSLIDVLADIHGVDANAVGLGDYGRPEGFVERQLRRFAGQWELSKTHDVAAVTELESRLRALLPTIAPVREGALVHGDYRLDNVILDMDDPSRVRAVLDWELSTLGDPLSDLGLLLFYWRAPGDPVSALIPSITAQPGFCDRREITEHYAQRTGADLTDIAFYEALAHFKFAVIAQGIAARVNAGAMAGQDFGDLDNEVLWIAEEGLSRLGAQ